MTHDVTFSISPPTASGVGSGEDLPRPRGPFQMLQRLLCQSPVCPEDTRYVCKALRTIAVMREGTGVVDIILASEG